MFFIVIDFAGKRMVRSLLRQPNKIVSQGEGKTPSALYGRDDPTETTQDNGGEYPFLKRLAFKARSFVVCKLLPEHHAPPGLTR